MDRKRTVQALRIAWTKFAAILPQFGVMLALVAVSLYLLPQEVIQQYLGTGEIGRSLTIALFAGSVTFMPGFIVFPLCGILREQGVPYMVLSGFTTTMMMVGVLSFPVEKRYMGTGAAVVRNLVGFMIAVAAALVTGLVFGEILK